MNILTRQEIVFIYPEQVFQRVAHGPIVARPLCLNPSALLNRAQLRDQQFFGEKLWQKPRLVTVNNHSSGR
jgi:hypothetical protein